MLQNSRKRSARVLFLSETRGLVVQVSRVRTAKVNGATSTSKTLGKTLKLCDSSPRFLFMNCVLTLHFENAR